MTAPVAILGGGIVGICCALSLAERGIRATIIERGEPGQETSSGNAGVISPWSFVPQPLPGVLRSLPKLLLGRHRPLAVRPAFWPQMIPWGMQFLRNANAGQARVAADAMELLCAPCIDLYRHHLAGTGAETLIRDSSYIHAFREADRASLKSLDYAIRREKGADLGIVGAEELHRLEPALSRDFKAAVVIKDQARALSPGRIGAVLARKAASLGVAFRRADVRSIRKSPGGWDVLCCNGTVPAGRIVVAMGAWSAELLKPLGIPIPLAAERGYHVEFPTPNVVLANSVMDVDAKFVASSMEDGLRVAGHAEFAAIDVPADPRRERLLLAQACATFPDLNPREPKFWMGRRPSLPDSLPILGAIAPHDGLFAAFGHSHYGLMMAPKTGEILADLLTETHPNVPLDAFRASRFRTKRTQTAQSR